MIQIYIYGNFEVKKYHKQNQSHNVKYESDKIMMKQTARLIYTL